MTKERKTKQNKKSRWTVGKGALKVAVSEISYEQCLRR